MKLITTDSYYNIFPLIASIIKKAGGGINDRKLIFCEEKISLMTERALCDKLKGTFSAEVYSFGGYLLKKKSSDKILSKEASSMVIKKLLPSLSLKCFSAGRVNFAPTLAETITQLKSAKVLPENLYEASESVGGILKNKLLDIHTVYSAYENYLKENGFEDQSSLLTYLPSIILNSEEIKNTDVYIIGYASFTAQIREIIKALIKTARSVTAILPYGENQFAFVNETVGAIKDLAHDLCEKVEVINLPTEYCAVAKKINLELFSPKRAKEKIETDAVFYSALTNTHAEIERVAEVIKQGVMNGKRYRDFKVIVPNDQKYADEIKKFFTLLEIPYFLDVKVVPLNHPLISLILSYIDAFRKNFERESVTAFYKNPLFSSDKEFNDKFENYTLKYNVSYNGFKKEFTYLAETEEELKSFNEFRQKICEVFSRFDVKGALKKLGVEKKINEFNEKLSSLSHYTESAVGEQVYTATVKLLDDMQTILSGEKISYTEFKNIFKSGVSAMELSLIPQYNDAVFVGDYRESALANTPVTFAVGLTGEVPSVSEDVALLCDADINALGELKVLVEPKIKVVNHRFREQTTLGLSSFSEKLYLTYPIVDYSGNKNVKSEIIEYFTKRFSVRTVGEVSGYLTKLQAKRTFAVNSGRFVEGLVNDFTLPSSYYSVEVDDAKKILEQANAEVKLKLDTGENILARDITSPTAIESYNVCPYRYFMEKGLRVKPREKGELSGSLVGVIMHEIFCSFTKRLGEIDSACPEESIARIFEEESKKTLAKNEFSMLLEDAPSRFSVNSALKECKKFCVKTYSWIDSSKFTTAPDDVEVKFGDGAKYPAVELLGGRVKLSGTIDRVDKYQNYCRIIDYKTGKATDDDKNLFAGVKLQLYLYALAIKDMEVAGAYYLPVKDKFLPNGETEAPLTIGKTLNDEDVLSAHDSTWETGNKFIPATKDEKGVKGVISSNGMKALISYAKKVSEQTILNMEDGFIAPTPHGSACAYCEFKSVCGGGERYERKIEKVDISTFESSIEE